MHGLKSFGRTLPVTGYRRIFVKRYAKRWFGYEQRNATQ
jgi:hypothetical protein